MTKDDVKKGKFIFNKITLSFDEKNERLFLKKYFSDSISQFRISFFLLIILYAAFGYLDSLVIPKFIGLFHFIRFAIVVPILSIVLLLSFTKFFDKIWQALLFICFIVGGLGISIMTMFAPENYSYYAGLMLIFSAGYFFIRLRFFLATIAGWSTLLLFNILSFFFADTPGIVLISYNFFFISANLIGMFAAYNIEFYLRKDFFLNQELDSQKKIVENYNKNLENLVQERTIELQKAKNEAEKSDKLKSSFLANMSHEIRTPMNGILGFTALLKNRNIKEEKHTKYIEIIEKSGARLLNLINDIIDISKIEAGLINVDIKAANINEQIEFLYAFFKPEVEKKGMQLIQKTPLSIKDLIIKTDHEKVYAVLINLVNNAIKFTEKGSIEFGYNLISSIPEEVLLEFFVSDTGIGIPFEKQETIFSRFIQADSNHTTAIEGSGLGLSISKAFVEMLGGTIRLKSEVGKGSTFYFTIPYITESSNVTIIDNVVHEKK